MAFLSSLKVKMTFFTLVLIILLSSEVIANHQYHLGSKDEKDVTICSKEKSYYAWPWQKYHYFSCKKATEVKDCCSYNNDFSSHFCINLSLLSIVAGTHGTESAV